MTYQENLALCATCINKRRTFKHILLECKDTIQEREIFMDRTYNPRLKLLPSETQYVQIMNVDYPNSMQENQDAMTRLTISFVCNTYKRLT